MLSQCGTKDQPSDSPRVTLVHNHFPEQSSQKANNLVQTHTDNRWCYHPLVYCGYFKFFEWLFLASYHQLTQAITTLILNKKSHNAMKK